MEVKRGITMAVVQGGITLPWRQRLATIIFPAGALFIAPPVLSAPYQQDNDADGLVVMEAEHFDANVDQGGHSWTAVTPTGASGTALQALPNDGSNNNTGYVTASPRLDYDINFVMTGTHYVWVRGLGATGNDDSVHVGLDGLAVATADRIAGFNGSFGWTRNTMDGVVATIDITSIGTHTLNVWMREDGFNVDKLLLTVNNAYTPAGTGPGENPRGDVPQQRFAYVVNKEVGSLNGASVSTYAVNAATGRFSYLGTIPAGDESVSVAVDPSSRYAYVANYWSNDVSQFTIGATGALTPMTPATVTAGDWPSSVTVDPSGRYVYVANNNSSDVSQFTIGATGALTPMTPATVPAGGIPESITVDSSGQYAYAANIASDDVSQYTIGADGALTPMTPATVIAGDSPRSVTVDPSGRYAYVANYSSDDVSQYTIGADGALTPMTPATIAAGDSPESITVDPSGRYVYVANNNSDDVSQYTIGADGALAPMTPATIAAGLASKSITVDPSGRYAYTTNSFSDDISQYTLGANGTLTSNTPPSAPTPPYSDPWSIAFGHGDAAPHISVSDDGGYAVDHVVAYGGVLLNSTEVRFIEIESAGATDLTISAISGPSAPFSVVGDTCSNQVLAPGSTCGIDVEFAPTVAGPVQSSVTVFSDDPDQPEVTVTTAGGAYGLPNIAITDSVAPADDRRVDFGLVRAGSLFRLQSVTITNNGTADLTLQGWSSKAPFTVPTNTCGTPPVTLAPGDACDLTVKFFTLVPGTYKAALSITSDDPDEPTAGVLLTGIAR